MTLHDLLLKADQGYSAEGFVSLMDCWDNEKRRVLSPKEYAERSIGDTLSLFVATELAETYDDSLTTTQQLAEAHRVLSRARHDIERTLAALLRPDDTIIEQHNHAVCTKCGSRTIPAERIPDNVLRVCYECGFEFFEDSDGTAVTTSPG